MTYGVYLLSGFFIVLFFSLFTDRALKILKWLIGLLLAYEFFEYIMYGVAKTPLFFPERGIDVAWDLIIGLIGGLAGLFVAWRMRKKYG